MQDDDGVSVDDDIFTAAGDEQCLAVIAEYYDNVYKDENNDVNELNAILQDDDDVSMTGGDHYDV